MDPRVPFSVVLSAFGAAASVVTSREAPAVISTRVAWLPPQPDFAPAGMDLRAIYARRILAIPKSTVPGCKIGTRVTVPEEGGGVAQEWRVDEIEREESDHFRGVMVPTS